MSEDIYDLGFETIDLELPIEQKKCFMMGGVKNDVVPNTIKYLTRRYQALKVIMSPTTNPEILKQISNSGLTMIRINYIPVWHEERSDWEATFPYKGELFSYYIIFKDQQELNFFKLTYEK